MVKYHDKDTGSLIYEGACPFCLILPVKFKPEFNTIFMVYDTTFLIHGIEYSPDYGKTDTTAAIFSCSCLIDFVESNPYFIKFILRNTFACVKYTYPYNFISIFKTNLYFIFALYMVYCIAYIVCNYFFNHIFVCPYICRIIIRHRYCCIFLVSEKCRRIYG